MIDSKTHRIHRYGAFVIKMFIKIINKAGDDYCKFVQHVVLWCHTGRPVNTKGAAAYEIPV